MRTRTTLAATALVAAGALLQAQQPSGVVIPVTVENFTRAESDRYFAAAVKKGGFGKFYHSREPTPIDKQTVIRMNRDTLYSSGVFDLDAGPVTITLPDAGKRFLSMQVIDEDHYTPRRRLRRGQAHPHARRRSARATSLRRSASSSIPANPKDVEEVHKLQDAIKVEQASAGKFEVPNWDPASQKKVRDALLVLGATHPRLEAHVRRQGSGRSGAAPDRHARWPGAAIRRRTRSTSTSRRRTTTARPSTGSRSRTCPSTASGRSASTTRRATSSRTTENAYTLNNLTAKKNDDGSVTIQFGGCDGKTPNCLPIMPGWNYIVRLYRPRKEILDGTWKFRAQPVK